MLKHSEVHVRVILASTDALNEKTGYDYAMNVPISELKTKMSGILSKKGIEEKDVAFVVNAYLGGELSGHTSHGLAGFAGFVNQDFSKLDDPEVIKETHSLFMIDAKSNSGNIVGRRAADEAIKRAQKEGLGISVIRDMNQWIRPGAVAEYIANQNFVALVTNSTRGAAVAPPGGYDPVVGTNPIAYGVPTNDGPLVVDMATSKRAWGQVRLANKYGTDLPADSFYDDQGNVTQDPKNVQSVMPFGDYKGFSLAMLVEILCGSLVDMPMMVRSSAKNSFGGEHPNTSAIIMVIDPTQTTELSEFKDANSEFIRKVKATRSKKNEEIRIPGEQAARKKAAKIAEDIIDIPKELWEEIVNLK